MAYGPPWMLAWTARGRERYIVVKRIHEVGARAFISQGTAAKRSDVAVSNWPLWQDLHNGHYEKTSVMTRPWRTSARINS